MKLFRRSSSTNTPTQSRKNRPRSISLSPSHSRNIEKKSRREIKISFIEQSDDEKQKPKEIPNYVTDLAVCPFDIYSTTLLNDWNQNFFYDKENPPLVLPVEGHRTEYGSDFYDIDNIELEEVEKHSPYYRQHFENSPHINFMGGDEINPFIISVLTTPDESGALKCILRTKQDTLISGILDVAPKKDKLIKALREIFPSVLKEYKLVEVKDPNLIPALANMEDRMLIKHYSFGVLYCKSGQKMEDEFFSNKEEDTSPAYEEFLSLLGDKVLLEGFNGPKAGLDTKTNTTGMHTIYTNFKGFDIVYHVATLLPYSDKNPQQLERKRHIGNDIICIVFVDGKESFDPSVVHTKFTHIFGVVQYYKDKNGNGQYKFAASNKEGVEEYGPTIPNITWTPGPEFRDFLLTKLINGERASYYSPNFGLSRTRRVWMWELISKYTS